MLRSRVRDAFASLGARRHAMGCAKRCRADAILAELKLLTEKVMLMSGTLSDLQAQVAQNTDVIQSAQTLIQGLAAQLAAAGTDPAALDALRQQLSASDSALAAAVAANTLAGSGGATLPGGSGGSTVGGANTVPGAG